MQELEPPPSLLEIHLKPFRPHTRILLADLQNPETSLLLLAICKFIPCHCDSHGRGDEIRGRAAIAEGEAAQHFDVVFDFVIHAFQRCETARAKAGDCGIVGAEEDECQVVVLDTGNC